MVTNHGTLTFGTRRRSRSGARSRSKNGLPFDIGNRPLWSEQFVPTVQRFYGCQSLDIWDISPSVFVPFMQILFDTTFPDIEHVVSHTDTVFVQVL